MTVIPVVIASHGTVTKGLVKGLENLEITGQVKKINDSIAGIDQNTEKSAGHFSTLVSQTPGKGPQLR